jgi:hypothetical protein
MKVVAYAVVLTVAMCSFAVAGKTATKKSNKTTAPEQQTLKMSYEGFTAMRAVRAARVAIFNGQPNAALKLLNVARHDLDLAAKNAPLFITTMEASVGGKVVAADMTVAKENWIPIDGSVSLSDTFVASPENQAHVKKANEHFKTGNVKKAVEELRLASIDVNCTRILMSLTKTNQYVADAVKLLGEQKYYEANLALKAAEDGMVVDNTNLFASPVTNNGKTKETN